MEIWIDLYGSLSKFRLLGVESFYKYFIVFIDIQQFFQCRINERGEMGVLYFDKWENIWLSTEVYNSI